MNLTKDPKGGTQTALLVWQTLNLTLPGTEITKLVSSLPVGWKVVASATFYTSLCFAKLIWKKKLN